MDSIVSLATTVNALEWVDEERSQDQGASEGEREQGRGHDRVTVQPHPDPWRIGAGVPGCDQSASRHVIAHTASGRHEISLKDGRGQSWEARRSDRACGAVVIMLPVVAATAESCQPEVAGQGEPGSLPDSGTVRGGNFAKAVTAAPFERYYFNSVVMTVGIVLGHLVCDTLAAYALARLRFPGRDAIFLGLVATMLVPAFLTVLPAFDLVIRFGWYNSYAALILPRLADVFGIVVLRGFMKSLPIELDEAARLDGANRMQILVRVLLPLCKPALASVAVFSFLFAWNDFLWPLLVTGDDQYRTIQLGLSAFTNKYGPYPNYLMAGTVIAATPAIVIFMYLQRSLVRGLASTGVKE